MPEKTPTDLSRKVFRPDKTDSTSEKAANPISRLRQPSKRHRQAIGTGPMNKYVRPKASQYTELTRERAEKLATLRRGKCDEFTWAAITGLVASMPSTIHSYIEIQDVSPFALLLPQAVDFGVTLIFITLVAVALISRNRGMSSMQYLETHFGPDPNMPPKRPWSFWGKSTPPA